MRKIILFAICSTMLVGPTAQALRFGPAPKIQIPDKTLVQFLSTQNEPLEKALEVHNLMTEMPALQAMAEQQKKIKSNVKEVQQFFDNLMKCNEKRLGRFKNPTEVLGKLRKAYKEKTKNIETTESYSADSIVPRSLAQRSEILSQKRDIEEALLTDVFKNGKKWGGDAINKKDTSVPENLKMKLTGTGLEELMLAEDGAINAKTADLDFDQSFKKMQDHFIEELADVGLQFPDFNAARSGDMYQVKKALQELKEQYLVEAKKYIEKLDAQDAAYPRAVARRAARTQNKQAVMKRVQDEFPDVFGDMSQLDQLTPQQRQRILIIALEKDKDGAVFLTETNATEIDQKMAEQAANKDMLKNIQDQAQSYVDDMKSSLPTSSSDFDFDQCSAG